MKTSGLAYLSLFVADIAKSRDFYGGLLGLPIVNDEDWGVTVQAGTVQLMLHPAESDAAPQNVEMVFDVEDLAAAFTEARAAGVNVLDEPQEREWGDQDGALGDPDGNRIYLRQKSA
jgi:catechol 2,3-dioxygenase-like lactoylglutathione lyase family enzyme